MRGKSSLVALCAALSACGTKATYPGQCGSVLTGWMEPAAASGELTLWNRVTLKKDGSLDWNGSPASPTIVAQLAHQTTSMNPRPFTILKIEDGADCGRVRVVRNLIDQQAKCQEIPGRLCGEGLGFTPDPPSR